MNKKEVYSNIAIDLGGKYTGLISYTAENFPEKEDINGAVLVMPDQGSYNYSVIDRTNSRHLRRAEYRYNRKCHP